MFDKPPMLAFQGVQGKLEYDQLGIRRFIKKHGLHDFTFNPHFPANTLLLMRGAIAAQNDGQLEAYIETGLRSMWERELKMDGP